MTSLSQGSTSTLTPCPSPAPEEIPVQPDHFFSLDNVQISRSPDSDNKPWLDPADDLVAQRGIPVFKPTMEEFQDFEGYMNRVECWGKRSGIVKVVPPKEWTDALPSIRDQLAEVKIKSPIEQVMFGDRGLFRQQNMEKRKWMSVREWVELCNKDDFRAPGIREVSLASRTVPVTARPRVQRRGKRKAESVNADGSGPVVQELQNENTQNEHAAQDIQTPPPAPVKEEPEPSSSKVASKKANATKDGPKPRAKRVHPTREAREASLADRAARDRAFIDVFDPHSAWLPSDTKVEDYTPEFCHQLERRYWRGLGLGGKPAWYGADTQGSLFTDATTAWNVAHLPSALSRLLPSSSKGLPGVNTPYLYFGMWRATFAWHVEDMDLFSINYIHFGAPKFWYAIPQGRAAGLEQAMRSHFPKDTSQCSQFLRHKSFLASPSVLAKDSCKPNCLVQQAGEFVVTYPRGYHAGFNLGLNCAESVNFALDSWIELGRKARVCECVSDSVRIDVDQLLKERDNGGESCPPPNGPLGTPFQTAQDFPKVELVKEEDSDDRFSSKGTSRKRKSEVRDNARSKKIKLKPSEFPTQTSSAAPATDRQHPRISITLKLGPRNELPEAFPCCLCVSMNKEGLLRVQNPPFARKDAAEAAGHPKVWMAHEFCANVVPETWVDIFVRPNGQTEKVVYGVDGIVKDRWNLKCSACTKSKPKAHGAPVQCIKGKCAKAFHVSCARDGHALGIVFGVVREVNKEVISIDNSPPSAAPRGTSAAPQDYIHMTQGSIQQPQSNINPEGVLKVVKKLEVQILCTQHNPAIAAQKKANKQDKIRNELMALPSMSRIKIRVNAGVFEVSLIRVIEETGSVEVLWDQNTKREFKWGSVILGSTDAPIQQPSDTMATAMRPMSAVPVPTFPSILAAAGKQVPVSQPPSLSNSVQQSTTQPSTSTSPLSAGNQMTSPPLPGTYPFGQGPGPVGATPYGVAPQQMLSYPYGYYGASMIGLQQFQSYGQLSYLQTCAQSQLGNGQIEWQQPCSTTADKAQNPIQAPSDTNQCKQTVAVSEPAGQGVPSVQSPDDMTPAQANQQVQNVAKDESSVEVAIADAKNAMFVDSNRSPQLQGESVTVNPELTLQPAQLAEILHDNPQLANMLLAAVGHQSLP